MKLFITNDVRNTEIAFGDYSFGGYADMSVALRCQRDDAREVVESFFDKKFFFGIRSEYYLDCLRAAIRAYCKAHLISGAQIVELVWVIIDDHYQSVECSSWIDSDGRVSLWPKEFPLHDQVLDELLEENW